MPLVEHDGPTWFSETTEDQVRQLLEYADFMDDSVLNAVLGWATGTYLWYAGNHVLVEMARESAERERLKGH